VARMLLRPSNLLLLDEPTNHLDLDSKDVLLDALVDYGGTLIFVSHDRYFVERLATRIIEVGQGRAESFPGTYQEFLWRKEHADQPSASSLQPSGSSLRPSGMSQKAEGRRPKAEARPKAEGRRPEAEGDQKAEGRGRKAVVAEQRKREKDLRARQTRVADLETRIAAHETAIKALEAEMAAPGFYEQRDTAQERVTRHQTLMWEVGQLMQQWELLAETGKSDISGDV
jgi:ATP-binding cassette, subfamily F, member 3